MNICSLRQPPKYHIRKKKTNVEPYTDIYYFACKEGMMLYRSRAKIRTQSWPNRFTSSISV
jgi:hypothetical protein